MHGTLSFRGCNGLVSAGFSLILAFFLVSCATVEHRETFDVELINVRLTEATLWETTAHFTVRLANATPETVTLDGSAHKFYLNGVYIGQGLSDQRIEVPRLNSMTQEITVHLRNLTMARRIRSIIEAQSVDYRVNSTLYLMANHRTHRMRVAREGRLSAEEFKPNFPLRSNAR